MPKAATLPTLRKHGQLMKELGCKRLQLRYDDQNRPYFDGFLDDSSDDLMGDRIDNA